MNEQQKEHKYNTKGGFKLGVGTQKWVGVQEFHSSHS